MASVIRRSLSIYIAMVIPCDTSLDTILPRPILTWAFVTARPLTNGPLYAVMEYRPISGRTERGTNDLSITGKTAYVK